MPSKFSLDINDYNDIDSRLKPFLKNWMVKQNYKGKIVTIPNTWESEIFPVKYFSEIKEIGEPNYDPNFAEDEIGLTLWAGWKEADNSGSYDHEVEINLFIMQKDVHDMNSYKVVAEILKTGGAKMELYFNNKLVTNFTKTEYRRVWWSVEIFNTYLDKVWIEDMKIYLN